MTTDYQANNDKTTVAAPTDHNPWLQTPTETPSATASTDALVFEMGRDNAFLFLTITTDRLTVMVTFAESVESGEDEQYRYSRSDFTADEFLTAIAGRRDGYEVYGWPSTTHPAPDNESSAKHILAFCRSHGGETISFAWGTTSGGPDVCLSLPTSYLHAALGQVD